MGLSVLVQLIRRQPQALGQAPNFLAGFDVPAVGSKAACVAHAEKFQTLPVAIQL